MSKDISKQEVETRMLSLYAKQLEIAKASVVSTDVFVALIVAKILKPCETFGCNCFILTPRGREIVISELDRLAEEETSVN